MQLNPFARSSAHTTGRTFIFTTEKAWWQLHCDLSTLLWDWRATESIYNILSPCLLAYKFIKEDFRSLALRGISKWSHRALSIVILNPMVGAYRLKSRAPAEGWRNVFWIGGRGLTSERLIVGGLEIFVKLLFQVFFAWNWVDKAPSQLPRLRRSCCCWKKLIIIPHLWPKRLKNRTLWDWPYLHSPYKGVLPWHQRLSPIPVRVHVPLLKSMFREAEKSKTNYFYGQ